MGKVVKSRSFYSLAYSQNVDVAAVPEPSEALIGRLMIHGIDRETAIHTLQASNNDLVML